MERLGYEKKLNRAQRNCGPYTSGCFHLMVKAIRPVITDVPIVIIED
jgi:hypothetical protein